MPRPGCGNTVVYGRTVSTASITICAKFKPRTNTRHESRRRKMAARGNAAVAKPDQRELVIERVFDAPRELVFKCWTEPEHLERWLGPKGFSGRIVACELREGGR